MKKEEIDNIVAATLAGLPEMFKSKLDNVVILVEDEPTAAQIKKFGANLLGLYEGIPLAARGTAYSGAMPDKITIFRLNLEKLCRSDAELKNQVAHTVLHELAHHFGIDDRRLMETGNY